MTAEGTACNGAGEAPRAEFPQGKAVLAPSEEKAAAEREGEDVGGPFVIVNGGDSDGHSDRGSDLGRAPDEDSPSEDDDVPASNAAPDAPAGGDHGAAGGEASASGAALIASSADGADRAADRAEGGTDEGRGEPSSDFVTQVPRQEAAGEDHGGAAASASSGSDPAVTGADSEAPAVDSEVEGKEETVDISAATDVAESVVHEVASKEQDGEDAAAESCGHDDAQTSSKSGSAIVESEVNGENSKEEQSPADAAEPVVQGTGGHIALVENEHLCADMRADSFEAAIESESQEDAAVESLGHDGAPLPAESCSAAMESEANGEDSKEEQNAADVVVPVDEGTDDACALMANGHVCADMRSDSFEASTEPESHANESKPEQNATEIAESAEGSAVCEDGTDTSQTNGHICVALSSDSCIVASESEVRAIEKEGQETNQQVEGAQPTKDEVLEGLLEAADRNCEGSVEELIEEEVNADGHSNAEGGADASRESENVDKQVQGEATCGILQLEEKLSSNEGVELPVGKATNEAVHDMCELEEVIENKSQETVQGEVKDGVSICTLHSLKLEELDPSVKSSLEHNIQAEVATIDESDLRAEYLVEVETAAREVEEIEVKDEADLAPFLSQQNCESSTETVEHEKIEAATSGQPNVIENDVAEVEPKKEHEREVVDAVPLQEALTFHNEQSSIDLVGSDSINHSSPVTELESCDLVHTEECRSREISETAVDKLVSGVSLEHETMVGHEAEMTPEENGSQEEPSDAAIDHGEPAELRGELEVDDAQLGSTTGYDSIASDTAGSISEKDELSETVGGSKSQENQSEIFNTSTTSDERSATIGNEVPSPINEEDETCNGTCPENVNVSIKCSEEVETKCLEALEPSSTDTAVLDKDNDQHAPSGLHGDHAQFIGPQWVYMMKIPRFASEDIWAKLQAAQAHLDRLTQERDAINCLKQNQKAVCDEYRGKLEAARREEREARAAHGVKKNDLNSVRSVIGKLHQAKSIEEIDELIVMKERTMQHETISLTAEKKLLKEINDLKAQRKQLSSNMGSKAELSEAFDQKDHIHERHKALKKDSDVLFTNLKSLEENTRKILKSFEDERIELRKLNEEFQAANELRQKAYSEWSELKAEPHNKNQYFFRYREDRKAAEVYKTSGDIYGLQSYCNEQIERVMKMWNENEDFRKQYVEANKFSTLRRLGTLEGRRLGPDEDPPVIPTRRPMNASSLTASRPDVPTLTSIPPPVLAAPAPVSAKDSFPVLPSPQNSKRAKSKASGSSAQNENNAVSTSEAEDIKQTEKEKARLIEEQLELARKAEELARKEEELRKERAAAEKERLRLEQKAKAKEAEERKRRKAEKEKERAEFKARKEAEEREKKKAKKDKKKGTTPADSSAIGDSNAAAMATADTDSNASDNPREVEAPQATAPKRLSRPAAAIKQLNRVQPMPAPLRNRGRRKMRQYLLIAMAVLSVLALFVAGNYIPKLKSLHQ
ncbi:uncharacterized protein LOC120661102 [Panicum virgatum]|nr:uncharacterized protein LOC120661102 [Panicum virgatum]KAG2635883.1 hypothetical protein PVAP13_2NG404600 [Panicum virgatum]KAG2635894.1 hypothetical protein PVAP13_2NG404600 [Panicum virgatum]KAG2635895.1 hypothetical protein PVAP13_2NG404600 [Panicum virgatum]